MLVQYFWIRGWRSLKSTQLKQKGIIEIVFEPAIYFSQWLHHHMDVLSHNGRDHLEWLMIVRNCLQWASENKRNFNFDVKLSYYALMQSLVIGWKVKRYR